MIPEYIKVSDKLVAKNIELNAKKRRRPIYALFLSGGLNGYLICGSLSTNFNGSLSFSCWCVGQNTITQGSFAGMVGRSGYNLVLYNRYGILMYNSVGVTKAVNSGLAENRFIHSIGMSYNSTTDNIYYYADNNKYGPTLMNTGTNNYGNNWYLAYSGNSGSPCNWVGNIYKFAIFNIVLTPTQITNLSNGSLSPKDIPGCVLYHDYTLGHAQDLSGNGNDGILIGGAQFIITGYD